MKTFRAFFILEFKRFIALRNAVILILFFSLCMILVYTGAQQYNDTVKSKKEFRETEKEKAAAFVNYLQYGGYGIRLYFMPCRLSILFYNSSLFSDLTAHVDVGEKLSIYNSFKGKKIFSARQGKFIDFSGIILLFGSFIALFYGYDTFRREEYLKFLSSAYGYRWVFFYIGLSRMILISAYFTVVVGIGGAAAVFAVKGIHLTGSEFDYLLVFLMVTLTVAVFFFFIGIIIGLWKSKFARFFMVICWVFFVFFAPEAINKIVEAKSEHIIDIYKSESEKLKTLMDFEREAAKKLSGKENPELRRKLAGDFLKNGFKKIQELEKELEDQVKSNINFFYKVSIIFPSTFYIAVNNEISSKGYENLMHFYRFATKRKKQFLDFYIKRRYPFKPRQEVESFIEELEKKGKNKEDKEVNVFFAASQLPGLFWLGLLLTILWIAGLSFLSFYLYEKSIFSVPGKKISGLNDLEIHLNKGDSHAILAGDNLRNHFYNVLSGQKGKFAGKVVLNGVNIVEESQKKNFVYICQPEEIPWDIKAIDFFSFIGRLGNTAEEELKVIGNKLNLKDIGKTNFNKMNVNERGRILFECALLKECGFYMIDNITKGMPTDFANEIIDRLEKLKQKGAAILYITNNVSMAKKIGDYMTLLKGDAELMGIKL